MKQGKVYFIASLSVLTLCIVLLLVKGKQQSKLDYSDHYTPLPMYNVDDSEVVLDVYTKEVLLWIKPHKTLYPLGWLEDIGNDQYQFVRDMYPNLDDNPLIETPFIFSISDDEVFKVWFNDYLIGYVHNHGNDNYWSLEYIDYSHLEYSKENLGYFNRL